MLTHMHHNKIVSFNTYAPAILGGRYDNVKVIGFPSYDSVRQYFEPISRHRLVYPSLPTGVLNDPSSYMYVELQKSDGTKFALGLPWIVEDSVEVIDSVSYGIDIYNATTADAERLRKLLVGAGYSVNIYVK